MSSAATTTGRTRPIHRRLHEALGTPAARVPPPRADPRRRREEALEARGGRDRRVAARSRASPPRRCVRTSRSSGCPGTTCASTCPGSADWRSRRSTLSPARSWRARVGADPAVRAGDARRARSRRGPRLCRSRSPSRCPTRRPTSRRSSASASSPRCRRATWSASSGRPAATSRSCGSPSRARPTGPELSAILAALPKEEALRRVDQALQHAQP